MQVASKPSIASGRVPLDGLVVVDQSPADVAWNHHVDPSVPQQRYAYDVSVIDNHGNLYAGDGARLEQWVGYGTPIHSPFAGTVVEAVDGWKELLPGQSPDNDLDAQANPAGNHVVIRLDDGNFAYLAHMKPGSVHRDLLGTHIAAGTVVGALGNSGNTDSPHLHVHIDTTQDLFDPAGVGVPLAFTNYTRVGSYRFDPDRGFVDWKSDSTHVDAPTVPHRGEVIVGDA